jgi:hypothetical protein
MMRLRSGGVESVQYLAILRVKPDTTRDQLAPLLKPEAARVWVLHTSGVLRSAHYLEGGGAVLLLEAASRGEAESHLNRLPLVEHAIVSVEILPLKPFSAFSSLFAPAPS